ncbi:3'(2'),5'-bisphosphate nucleotidase CysQ [Ciceribacter sp. L1K22]|uniref:3'(2'),5'-bisphosphate nucleotidase CysQ n=1 Tax=Ciceribacter sp. L1K22 TaxID=2820275 RepID=UPI001ABEBD3D|nr:3'(2'),5'-bisphosphate nucleotidase CysQ [Ciceribacter sp. L1K22]MBO3758946.1 3'(2'),5'-bisphosphate nucleotidase CysQ [Ciceribacter sp. L1K22]
MVESFLEAALEASRIILSVRKTGPEVELKADCSPVTEADRRAETLILDRLAAHHPSIPVVAEEAVAAGCVPDISGGRFILVDPLDGTREFIDGRADFTVNIALIENGVPIAGVVVAPAKGLAYLGENGHAEKLTIGGDCSIATREPIRARPAVAPPVAVASRSHGNAETDAYLVAAGVTEYCAVGSSLKFCLVAEARADIYPRFSPTMEWDTAAGDAILRAAGGRTLGLDGEALRYGKRDQAPERAFGNPSFIAHGAPPIQE